MAGIGITTASAGSDAIALSKTSSRSKSAGGDAQGFQDALSSSANNSDANAPSKLTATDASAAQTSGTQAEAGTTPGAAPAPASNPPTIAPGGNGTLSAALPATPVVGAEVAMPAMPTDQLPAIVPDAGANPAQLSAADIAQQLAAVKAGDATAQPATSTKGELPSVKGSKDSTAADDAKEGEVDTNAATGATLTDVLSLLGAGVPAAIIPAQTSPSVLSAAGQLHTGNGKVDPGIAATASALPADVVDGSGDAAAVGMAMLATGSGQMAGPSAGMESGADAGSTVTFNVDRASGKVQSLDLSAAKSVDDAPQLDIKGAGSDTGATITVLDSRRFVGLADGSNSALVANSLTGNKDWAAAMQPGAALTGASATTSASKVMNTLKIQMNPDNLGIVTATMRLSGEQLSVDLKVHSAEAYRQLSNDQSAMIDSLRQQGYSVDRMTVTYTAPDTSSNQQSSQGQQQQQQAGTSQGQGSDGQARKQNSGRQAGDQDGVSRTGNLGVDDSLAGSAQRARAGGVYL